MRYTPERPKRVLHIVIGMARAGVETWLMHALRGADPQRLQMDFLVHTDRPYEYDAEIEQRNARILRCTEPKHSPAYARRFCSLLRQHGPYDAVHSHVHHFSGHLLWLAKIAGIPLRIAHSHSDTSRQDSRSGMMRRAYLHAARQWIQVNATHLVGASRVAAHALFGRKWDTDLRKRLLHCGIDLSPFRKAPKRSAVRDALGIRPDEMVIGHTGRFGPPKNHSFVVDIAEEAARHKQSIRLLLIGDGPTRPAIEDRLRQAGLLSRTIFAGIREDVPELLQAMDVFLFPSLWEGLPLTVLEAQAAGLPCVISDVISAETDIVPGLIHRLPLSAPPSLWASEMLAHQYQESWRRPQALALVESSSFNIRHSLNELYTLYGV